MNNSQLSSKSSQSYNEEMLALLQRKKDLLQNSKNSLEIEKLIALQKIQKQHNKQQLDPAMQPNTLKQGEAPNAPAIDQLNSILNNQDGNYARSRQSAKAAEGQKAARSNKPMAMSSAF